MTPHSDSSHTPGPRRDPRCHRLPSCWATFTFLVVCVLRQLRGPPGHGSRGTPPPAANTRPFASRSANGHRAERARAGGRGGSLLLHAQDLDLTEKLALEKRVAVPGDVKVTRLRRLPRARRSRWCQPWADPDVPRWGLGGQHGTPARRWALELGSQRPHGCTVGPKAGLVVASRPCDSTCKRSSEFKVTT